MREHNAVVQELEEVFFERNFEPGEDEENLSRAKKLYGEWKEKAEKLAQDLEDGLLKYPCPMYQDRHQMLLDSCLWLDISIPGRHQQLSTHR